MALSAQLGGGNTRVRGFTLVELIVVVAIVGMMTSLLYFATSTVQTSTDAQTAIDRLVAHIKTQRIYAMLGSDSNRTRTVPHGIHFDEGSGAYTLFSCPQLQSCSYTPGMLENSAEHLGDTLVFRDVSLSGNQLIFSPQSGEVVGFDSLTNQIVVESLVDRKEYTLKISSLGTVVLE